MVTLQNKSRTVEKEKRRFSRFCWSHLVIFALSIDKTEYNFSSTETSAQQRLELEKLFGLVES